MGVGGVGDLVEVFDEVLVLGVEGYVVGVVGGVLVAYGHCCMFRCYVYGFSVVYSC